MGWFTRPSMPISRTSPGSCRTSRVRPSWWRRRAPCSPRGGLRHGRSTPTPSTTRPEMSLDGRVAIVTGGARGIGLAIVEDLVGNGASVVIVDSGVSISGEILQERIAEEIAAKHERTVAVCGDVAAPGVARRAVAMAQERFGSVDIRSEEHTSELQSHSDLVCRLLLDEKKLRYSCRRPVVGDDGGTEDSCRVRQLR